jgi:hypothetical protein
VIPKGNKQATNLARAAVRDSGAFNLKASMATVEGINHKHCHPNQMGDGSAYHLVPHVHH